MTPNSNRIVTLDTRELIQAAFVGIMRRVENLGTPRQDADSHIASQAWQADVQGAIGELALAKYLGVYWSGAHKFRGTDVEGWEVRCAQRPNDCLPLKRRDDPEKHYVLMIGSRFDYRCCGYIKARHGMLDKWWRTDLPGQDCWLVPQSALESL